MRTVSLSSSSSVTLYQSIFELEADRYAEFQHYLLQDTHIGSTMADVQRHFQKLDQLLADNRLEEAADERALLHYNLQFILEKFSPLSLAFGCLVHSVNNDVITDRTEEGLQALVTNLSLAGLTAAQVEWLVEDVKKNSIPS